MLKKQPLIYVYLMNHIFQTSVLLNTLQKKLIDCANIQAAKLLF